MANTSYKVTDGALADVIRRYCRDLTTAAVNGELDPVAHAGNTAAEALKLLAAGGGKASVAITVEAGMGASCIFHAVAQQISSNNNVPPAFVNARVLEPEISMMAAGPKFSGQLEERVKALFDGLSEREGMFEGRKVIIALGDLQRAFKIGRGPDGIGRIFEPFATSKGVAIIGVGPADFCSKAINADGALSRRFSIIPFAAGYTDHNLGKAFIEGSARAINVRPPISLRLKTPGMN